MNANEKTVSEALLWRYFAGQTSVEETDLLAAWVKNDENNRAEFQRVKELFYSTAYAPIRGAFDHKKAFKQFDKTKSLKRIYFRPWISVAAAIAILIVTSVIVYHKKQPINIKRGNLYVYSPKNNTVNLPDSSIVVLNFKSNVYYRTDNINSREVSLNGEAYFDVTHKMNNTPFEIYTDKVKIKVLGTAFNINSRNRDSVVVSVLRGKVQVNSINNPSNAVIVHSGQSVCFLNNRFTKVMSFFNNALAWKEKKIIFDATPLSEVVNTLNGYFDKKISLKSVKKDQQLTVTFINPEIDSVIDLIKVMYNLEVKKTETEIVLRDSNP